MDELLKNNLGLTVLTDTGWSSFDGILIKGVKHTVNIRTQRYSISCTLDHKLYLPDYSIIEAKNLKPTQKIIVNKSVDNVVSISLDNIEPVYDLFNVGKNHRYYANNILVKNCEFLVYDETLINSIKLAELVGKDPITRMGQVRWFKTPKRGNIYIAALDPSLGTGGDFAGIQVFELPSFDQVAEWQHNITPIQGQIKLFRDVLRYIQDEIGIENSSNIYWSIENNTVGEAGLVVVSDLGEETFPGLFLCEPGRKGHVRKFRKGFLTTHGAKISACSRLKFLIEEDKMRIFSKALISELKAFIAHGITFKAKSGQHDDLVSALLLVVRMSVVLADWDPAVFETLSVGPHFDDDWEAPLPIFISTTV